MLDDASAGSKTGRPSIIVTIGVDRLLGETGADPAVLLGSGPLPDEAVNEVAKKANVLGQVFGGDGQPLWLGRNKRLATYAQFVAVMARDGGCISCHDYHPELVAHHVIPVSSGPNGKTDIENLAILGSGCHTVVHANHARLVWDPGERHWDSRPARPEERARPRPPNPS